MKASKLKKDKSTTVRLSSIVDKKLKKEGLSVQKVFDKEIDKKFLNLEVRIK